LSLKAKSLSVLFILVLSFSICYTAVSSSVINAQLVNSATDPAISASITAGNDTNVLLLGWDGVQRNHLLELISRGKMPNLNGFIQSGRMINITVSDHNTDTKAGWSEILTGYRWWKTGVFSNNYWFHSIPRGYTIPERLENFYGSNRIVTAFITGKLNQMEIQDGTGTAASGNSWSTYSNQALYANLPSQLDVVSVGNLDQDRYANTTGPMMIQFIQNNTNNHVFAFFHFSDPDHLGHQYGENSAEYEQGIETCDYWLGQILGTINTLGLAQKTLIYITADHGFDEGGVQHFNAPYVFLATNDNNVCRNGDEVDVAPTIYYGLGLWNQTFMPALDGYPLQVGLTDAELQHRNSVLADTTNLQVPTISITDSGTDQKTVTVSASDNNLAVVYLLLDNVLLTDFPLSRNSNGVITASGSYNISTAGSSSGAHTVKVFAFDEHGANNAGPGNDPANGGAPSVNSITFNVGSQPVQSTPIYPTASPIQISSPSPTSNTHIPVASPSPTSPTLSQEPSNEPKEGNSKGLDPLFLVPLVILAVGLGVYITFRAKLKKTTD
jgi:hypothetical protein